MTNEEVAARLVVIERQILRLAELVEYLRQEVLDSNDDD